MTRARGELPEAEEALLGIERPTIEEEEAAAKITAEKLVVRRVYMHQLMESDIFREWLMETLQGFRTFENTFGISPNGSPDQAATHFAAGMKAAGWHLWCQFDDIAPDLASLMRRDATKPKP